MLDNMLRNPALYFRKAIGRARRAITSAPDLKVVTVGGGVRFEHRRLPFLDDGDYRAMLTRSYDIELCDVMRRTLRPGDTAIDVGANVGYITAIAASLVGPSGEVHSFEPLSECFARLERTRELNSDHKILCNRVALGDREGMLPIAFDPNGDSRNATLVPGYSRPRCDEVRVTRLDAYISEFVGSPGRIRFIKIDVEGFEFSVLKGMEGLLSTDVQPDIVVEIKPWEITKLGATMKDFRDYMQRYHYEAYDMRRGRGPIDLLAKSRMHVVVFRSATRSPALNTGRRSADRPLAPTSDTPPPRKRSARLIAKPAIHAPHRRSAAGHPG